MAKRGLSHGKAYGKAYGKATTKRMAKQGQSHDKAYGKATTKRMAKQGQSHDKAYGKATADKLRFYHGKVPKTLYALTLKRGGFFVRDFVRTATWVHRQAYGCTGRHTGAIRVIL